MAQRREPHDSLDFFPTPAWATRALCTLVLPRLAGRKPVGAERAWEPACGEGHMARPLAEYFAQVHASDVFDYGFGAVADFLWPGASAPWPVEWVITNPPFRLGEQFIDRALAVATKGVAVFVRAQFLESIGRYERLFGARPPSIAYFAERVPLVKGRVDAKASSATAYVWLVWCGTAPPRVMWIPPCRGALERRADYGGPQGGEAAPAGGMFGGVG